MTVGDKDEDDYNDDMVVVMVLLGDIVLVGNWLLV